MDSREQFEAWAIANRNAWFPDLTRSINTPENYYGVATQAAWEAWQASRADIVVTLPEKIEFDQYTSPEEASSFNSALEYCEAAIQAAGVSVK